MANPLSYLHDQLEQWRSEGTYQRLRILESESAAESRFDGKQVINLASNNYLGLTTHPKLREAALEAVRKYGVGSGAVRTISGTMTLHMQLEERIAAFKNVEACVVFQSGFAANAGTVAAILGTGRPHRLRRAEPRQHHRWLPAVAGQDPRLPAQGRGRGREDSGGAGRRARTQAADHRRRFLHGWRHRPAARPGGSRRKARRHHDGGRRALLRRAGPQRPRHHRPFRPARPRAHAGGHAFESHRRAGRICLRQPRPDRVSVPPRAPVPVFDFASAGRGRCLPGRVRRAGAGAGAHRAAVGEHALLQGRA